MHNAREEEKKLFKQKIAEDAEKNAQEEAEKQAELDVGKRKYMKASERFAQKPKYDANTYFGKIKILKDVKEEKYPLPVNFPTTKELQQKFFSTKSPDYLKTNERRN